ncbi:hypothetical protein [Streptococcus lutetiensis]|uniref:hypothetical protein n=1 Tax=Streptococcus lutetiensis TaxID=150055 RepID=UPI001C0FD154|nr:hypothetical protein [Streptococcus lutetiensis]MBU5320219.1 hypothetical protein [Streptococcus lutetiensis]
MNETQEMKIKELRDQGLGYKRIANRLSISVDAVKYFCRKNNLTGTVTPWLLRLQHWNLIYPLKSGLEI